jgi:hypothetical protein
MMPPSPTHLDGRGLVGAQIALFWTTAQAFFDAEILRDEVPGNLVSSMTWDLLQTLEQNADLLMRDYSLDRACADWDGRQWGRKRGRAYARTWVDTRHEFSGPCGELSIGFRARPNRTNGLSLV